MLWSAMPTLNRRDFLKLLTNGLLTLSGLLGLGAILRFLGHAPEAASPSQFDLGPADRYPVGSRTVIPSVPALLIHDESGFHALSLVCTHLGCTVETTETGFECPCHGSRFDRLGRVTHGPAGAPLPALRVEVSDEGNVIVYLQ